MEIFKKSGKIYLTSLKFEELITLLKIQVNCELIFTDKNKTIDETKTIILGERTIINNIQQITFENYGQTQTTTYDNLLGKISLFNKESTMFATIEQNDFRSQEALIRLIPDINIAVVQNCVYMSLNDDVYTIKYKPFKNGDSNILYYFEINNTLLAFTETGPTLVTENPKMNNITDIICN